MYQSNPSHSLLLALKCSCIFGVHSRNLVNGQLCLNPISLTLKYQAKISSYKIILGANFPNLGVTL